MSGTLKLYTARWNGDARRGAIEQARVLKLALHQRFTAHETGRRPYWLTTREIYAAHKRAGHSIGWRTVQYRVNCAEKAFARAAVANEALVVTDDVAFVRVDFYRAWWAEHGRKENAQVFSDEDVRAVFDVWKMR